VPLPGYSHEVGFTVTAPGGGLAAGAIVRVEIETRKLIAAGMCRPDRRDFRVTYNGTEIDRVLTRTNAVFFRLQAPIAGGGESTAYALNYGRPAEATEPAENPRNVWPAYYDGNDIAALTVSGTVTATDMPRPGFIKVGGGPVIQRGASGAFDYSCIREVELFHDGTYFWATYDAYALPNQDSALSGLGLARSTDLVTWEKRGRKADGPSGRWNDAIIHQLPGQSGLHITWFVHSTNNGSGVPWPPYTLHIATADSIEGTWTDQTTFPRVGGENYNVDGHIFTLDGGTTWHLIHGIADADGTYSAHATGPTPLGPWTRLGAITASFSGNENPKYLADGSFAFLINNVISNIYTRSNALQWRAAGGFDFSGSQRLAIVEPGDPGDWDDYAIGMFGQPVIKDGMIYGAYDANKRSDVLGGGFAAALHHYRHAGAVEARWPFRWGKSLSFVGAATATTPTLLAAGADGDVRVRAEPAASINLVGGGESFRVYGPVDQYGSSTLEVAVNGVPVTVLNTVMASADANGFQPSQTILFRRAGGVLSISCQGVPLWQGASTAALALEMSGTWVEEAIAAPTTAAATIVFGEFTASAGPVVGNAVTLSGSRLPGSTITVT
jgi:hypothetical protein